VAPVVATVFSVVWTELGSEATGPTKFPRASITFWYPPEARRMAKPPFQTEYPAGGVVTEEDIVLVK
jgi:hypothetical protein